jgi:septum site-determining protein MinC
MEVLAESEAAATLKRAPRRSAFELKGVMTSLAVLRLGTADLAPIERQLRIKIAQLPQFFQDAPVLLDLGAMPDGGAGVPLAELSELLRRAHLIPIGVTNAGDQARALAASVGLGVMPDRSHLHPTIAADPSNPSARVSPTHATAASRGPATALDGARAASRSPAQAEVSVPALAHNPPLVVRQPVRGGQVIYAQRSDLVVLAPVNPGAEVIADGHVHIYATLRGRAVAGARGAADARIFCQKLEAELVAVAGAYVMADDIPAERRGRAAQIFLEGGECRVVAL